MKKLIAGPTVFICDECVVLCFDIITEEGRVSYSDISEQGKLSLRELAIRRLMEQVEDILSSEEKKHQDELSRHDPYKKLADTFRQFNEIEDSLKESAIATIASTH